MRHSSNGVPNRRVLVVDDNPAIHGDFVKILSGHNAAEEVLSRDEADLFGGSSAVEFDRPAFEVDTALQGEEALAMVATAVNAGRPYALAFVDVRMPPGLDGIETTARLWAADPELQVVVCTAYSDYSWGEMIAKLGHSDGLLILKKPFDTVEVLQLAVALTRKWALLQQTKQRMADLETLVAARTAHLEAANSKLAVEISMRKRREDCLRLQSDVARLLANSGVGAEQLTRLVLSLLCDSMRWDLGRLWVVEVPANALCCAGSFSRASRSNAEVPGSLPSAVPEQPGCGLAGHVWRTGQPLWLHPQSPQLAEFVSSEQGGAAFTAGLAFPLRLEGRVTGVLEFWGQGPEEDDGTLLQGVETIGGLVGQALERRAIEDQLRQSQKMEAIGSLAGGIAHDFNNILTVISGYGQLLKNNPRLIPELAGPASHICLASERAAMLTRQLLTFSRKQLMQPRPLDLNKTVAQTEGMLRRVIPEHIRLKFEPCPEPAVVNADEGMLSQVLMNLACNARDAMPEGGELVIRISLTTLDESAAQRVADGRAGDFVCLSVQDNGSGIKPEHLPRLFEPFFTTKDIGRGTGLGLCTAYGIVKQHRGWIEVKSALGVGTCFTIYLPRSLEVHRPRHTEFFHKTKSAHGETILLVEDEAPVRSLAGEVLKHQGYQVLEAASGMEALSLWDQNSGTIDMLLTDVVMPDGLNGRDLALKLRTSRGDLPVLLVSGYSPNELNLHDQLEGSRFLPKPYTPQRLVETVRRCLDHATVPA